MPELPEVETVRRTLSGLIVGEKIKKVTVTLARIIIKPEDIQEFETMLEGQTFQALHRRGKFLRLELDDYTLVSHLRMEGRYGVVEADEEVDKHTHVRFTFESGKELRYSDVRQFGTMHVFKKGEELTELPLKQLGPEPLDADFNASVLKDKVKRSQRAIKTVLLDQTKLVGLGNIYVDETLYRSRIHPTTPANSLTDKEYEELAHHIKATLQEAVDLGGSSIKSYVNGQGEMGMFQQTLAVYGRTGEPCHHCEASIIRSVVGGRGTHTCPVCQPIRT
ncbi:DNA-formamidopyrimidine glycosylase [Paenalkalicoccus suaedae]|uniref:Formamidopyrimidine-DNA glycosylase n=1 Tax=Paenalkalicoccus suaedae TaxID=2592382 RepID=A0A859FIH8_9BACI|nr:DNA-formamidopyrimidine glycosylase [Paenalkalicoccus suaedae]QKS72026.1 DNA-formamidopyrimidine glycosylase [Paenalkalicoccus suaedae]